jgi:hypothetical protein
MSLFFLSLFAWDNILRKGGKSFLQDFLPSDVSFREPNTPSIYDHLMQMWCWNYSIGASKLILSAVSVSYWASHFHGCWKTRYPCAVPTNFNGPLLNPFLRCTARNTRFPIPSNLLADGRTRVRSWIICNCSLQSQTFFQYYILYLYKLTARWNNNIGFPFFPISGL